MGNPLQYSCLKNSMDRGAQQATILGIAESFTTEHTFYMILFFSLLLSQFSLFLIFESLIMTCLSENFFGLYPFEHL